MTWNAKEVTELTIGNTNVGSVNVTVYLPGNFPMGNLFFTQFIGYKHQFRQRGLFKKGHSFPQ